LEGERVSGLQLVPSFLRGFGHVPGVEMRGNTACLMAVNTGDVNNFEYLMNWLLLQSLCSEMKHAGSWDHWQRMEVLKRQKGSICG
jgi:hypothetical protein